MFVYIYPIYIVLLFQDTFADNYDRNSDTSEQLNLWLSESENEVMESNIIAQSKKQSKQFK